MEAIRELFNNPAFWAFAATAISGWFTYKGLFVPYQNKKKGKIDVKNVSTFEELKAAVELLQSLSERKDKQHQQEVERLYTRIHNLETDNDEMYKELTRLKTRLREAGINHEI